MEQGFKKVKEFGVNICTSLILRKGISDCYPRKEVSKKLGIMESIEIDIKVHENERFGYGQSEALITLISTPNNTFPIFWKEKGGRVAPFPRY